MNTKFFIAVSIITAFSFAGCTTRNNFDFKATVIPQTTNSIIKPGDLNKASEVINKRLLNFFNIPQKEIKLDTRNGLLHPMNTTNIKATVVIKNIQ